MTPHDPPDPHATKSYLNSFSPETQKELSKEDTQAWTAIVSLLLGIICTGVLLAVVCVFLTSR
jgi:hypothetical protein